MSFKQVIPPPEDMEKIRLELMKVVLPEVIRASYRDHVRYVSPGEIAGHANNIVESTLVQMYGAA